MENLTLSKNVRQYFINILKGIGLRTRDANNSLKELGEADIGKLLDSAQMTPHDLYRYIATSISLTNDVFSGKGALRKDTIYDRNTVKNLLSNIDINEKITINGKDFNLKNIDGQACDNITDWLTGGTVSQNGKIVGYNEGICGDLAIENIMMTLQAGLVDQKLSNDEKDEALAVWEEIQYAKFKEWLIKPAGEYEEESFKKWMHNHKSNERYSQLYASGYHLVRVQDNLLNEIAACCAGNKNVALKLMRTKIQGELLNRLAANKDLLKRSREFCEKRCKVLGKSAENELLMSDVLMAAGNERLQVINFFQSRSKEQEEQQKNDPKKSGVKKDNKIGNLMGRSGRQFVKELTGCGASVAYDELLLKDGKRGPWRGYKALFERILGFMGEFYGNVQSIGFVQRMLAREGYDFNPEGVNREVKQQEDYAKAWKTDYQAMPEEYVESNGRLNTAGEFYNKTKARILADKMRLSEYTAKMQDFVINQSDPEYEHVEQVTKYLQERIARAENIIKTQIPNSRSAAFGDSQYYAMLEEQIFAEQEDANKDNVGVQEFLAKTKHQDANEEMLDALLKFGRMATDAITPNQINAKREMAIEMFNLGSKVEDGKISGEDLDKIAEDFVTTDKKGKNLLHNHLRNLTELTTQGQKKAQLIDKQGADKVQHDSNSYRYPATWVAEDINFFTAEHLAQNAMKEKHDRYQTEQYRNEILNGVNQEAEREM